MVIEEGSWRERYWFHPQKPKTDHTIQYHANVWMRYELFRLKLRRSGQTENPSFLSGKDYSCVPMTVNGNEMPDHPYSIPSSCPEGLEAMHASVFNRESLEQLFAGCELRTMGDYIVVMRRWLLSHKAGVDSPEEVAARRFDALLNQDHARHQLHR